MRSENGGAGFSWKLQFAFSFLTLLEIIGEAANSVVFRTG